ncbi:BLUF domain-containing protein [Methylobacterium sp. JK268]
MPSPLPLRDAAPLHRLLYRSEAALPGREALIDRDLDGIVAASQARNAAAGLTGALLHVRGTFLQVLEGPLPALEATFERICCDLRHRRVVLLELTPAETRLFGAWSMTRVTPGAAIDGLLPSAAVLQESGADSISARATVDLMRALLLSGGEAAGRAAAHPRAAG